MRVAVFSTKPYDKTSLHDADPDGAHELVFLEPRLNRHTAALAEGCEAVCAFVNDDLDAATLAVLAERGVRFVALRSAGFNHIDLRAAAAVGIAVARVPDYSPYAVAEHCAALVLALNRKTHRAYNRIREHNFALTGLLGFDLHGRTVGVVGTGKIGLCFVRIMAGFGCRVLAYDPYPNSAAREAGAEYVGLDELLAASDIVSLHCPLTPETYHLIGRERIALMRPGVMLVNTSRGALVDTAAVVEGLKSGRIGHLGLDVYEEEAGLFFEDLSDQVIGDDAFDRLNAFPNVLITGHQAFFTAEALEAIAATTIANLTAFERDGVGLHPVSIGEGPGPNRAAQCNRRSNLRHESQQSHKEQRMMDRQPERIVVAIDGSPASLNALRWAIDHADRLGAVVEALHVWQIPNEYGVPIPTVPGESFEGTAERALQGSIDEVLAGRTDAPVEAVTLQGYPPKRLVERSQTADLLVVGSRGRGALAGTLLGSVSLHCVTHAKCPIVVIRS